MYVQIFTQQLVQVFRYGGRVGNSTGTTAGHYANQPEFSPYSSGYHINIFLTSEQQTGSLTPTGTLGPSQVYKA